MTQDYPDENKELIEKLSRNVNDSFESLYEALNKRLSFSDNIACTVRDVDVIVDSNGDVIGQVGFPTDLPATNVTGCICVRAQNLTNSSIYPTGTPFINFIQLNDFVRILNVSNLQANNRYRLRIIALN
jgi:hypothetical protein